MIQVNAKFVLDCSVAVAWLFDDEANPKTDALLKQLVDASILAPAIWPLEIGNTLIQSEKRGRITQKQLASYLVLLSKLPIIIDDKLSMDSLGSIISLAQKHNLTSYDAAYLELAIRHHIPLATLDKALLNAASARKIVTLPN